MAVLDIEREDKMDEKRACSRCELSARGARILYNHFDEQLWEKGHWDLCFKEAVQGEAFQEILKCCYPRLALVGFDDHVSSFQNTISPKVRQCLTEAYKSRQKGTRECVEKGRACSRSAMAAVVPQAISLLSAFAL